MCWWGEGVCMALLRKVLWRRQQHQQQQNRSKIPWQRGGSCDGMIHLTYGVQAASAVSPKDAEVGLGAGEGGELKERGSGTEEQRQQQ
jgi:hypothetical protein